MGDTGSLALGGSLGAVGVVTKHEIVLAITGGLFVFRGSIQNSSSYFIQINWQKNFYDGSSSPSF